VIRAGIERVAAGARNVAQWQQRFGRGEIFACTPVYARQRAARSDKPINQGGLSAAGFSGDGDYPPAAIASHRKRLFQALQLFFAL
jgi:hypothetical protein